MTKRHSRGQAVSYTEIAGVLLEYRDTILSALNARSTYCERCQHHIEALVDGEDLICPRCSLVL